MPPASVWSRIRRAWGIAGLVALVIFTVWAGVAYQATAEGAAALVSDSRVDVARRNGYTAFIPHTPGDRKGLVFFPGALVDPIAYAPLAHAVADSGYAAAVVDLPYRGAFGGADGPEVLVRALRAMAETPGIDVWVAAGHSRGGAIAARLVRGRPREVGGLILIGTSHPRDFSLAALQMPVTRIYGSRDTVASVSMLDKTRGNLPPAVRIVAIDGGNHSQFGYYGFQPGDWPATITRPEQQRQTLAGILATLAAVSGSQTP